MSREEPSARGNLLAVVGSGIVGLSIALELRSRGHEVELLEASPFGRERAGKASLAGAGMLAATDPHRPALIAPLAEESLRRYRKYFEQIEVYSSHELRFQTDETVEHGGNGTRTIAEHSLEPRELYAALVLAVANAGVRTEYGVEVVRATDGKHSVVLETSEGGRLERRQVVFAGGAWMQRWTAVHPRKGQMLRVRIPAGLDLRQVHRAPDVYVVPRLHGAQQGSALIGATIENVGFNTDVDAAVLADLRRRASRLVPELADEAAAPTLQSWAGLRPGSPDDLPLIGFAPGSESQVIAGGHFRDGILLAPVTAAIIADLIEGREPALDLAAYAPARFAQAGR